MGLLGDIAGSITNAAGSLLGGGISAAASIYESREARKWMEKMSNSAHQREVRDLRKAGLNPILSAGGSGASVNSTQGAPIPDLGKNIASAAQWKQIKADTAIKSNTAESSAMDVNIKRKAFQWLDQNPKFKDLFYSGIISKEAGLNSSIYAPMMGVNSAGMKRSVNQAIDYLAEHPEVLKYMPIPGAPMLPSLFKKKPKKSERR